MKSIFTLAFSASLVLGANIYASEPILRIAGCYNSITSSGDYPLLLQKNRLTQAWYSSANVALPDGASAALARSLTCEGKMCYMVGNVIYQGNEVPFVTRTEDGGNTWQAQLLTQYISDKVAAADLFGGNCFGNNCFILKSYINRSGEHPLLLNSSDFGKTWNWVDFTKFLPNNTQGAVDAVTCHDKMCVTVGYSDVAPMGMFILRSADGGQSWLNDAVFSGLPQLSDGNVYFYNNQFFVISNYSDGNSRMLPLILSSVDNGKHWEKLYLSGVRNDLTYNPWFMTCHGDTCILPSRASAVDKKDGGNYTLAFVSHNKGKTWMADGEIDKSIFQGIMEVMPPVYSDNAWLLVTYGRHQSTILISNDEGHTWAKPNFPTLSPTVSYVNYSNMDCDGSHCVVAGTYQDSTQGNGYQPFVMESADGGRNWQLSRLGMLPDGLKNVFLFGVIKSTEKMGGSFSEI